MLKPFGDVNAHEISSHPLVGATPQKNFGSMFRKGTKVPKNGRETGSLFDLERWIASGKVTGKHAIICHTVTSTI